ncbi:MAG: hypothetical protein JXL84_14015 [Deltaproteobacteria bacterium]|nr:hypothetical protein [Deltaproteobacteria bacterium]
MTSGDRSQFSRKHAPEKKPQEEVVQALRDKAKKGELPCAVAFSLAADLGVPVEEVGFTADILEIPIVKCQLGLYGYRPEKRKVKPAATVAASLKDAIQKALVDGRLPCAAAWQIADELHLHKMAVSSACEAMKIKITSCQLGAF